MNKRLLFLDLDGTLLDDDKQITAGNRAALERALEYGHGVIITTGRPLRSAMEQAQLLGLDCPGCYLIAYNGAIVYDWTRHEQIFTRTLPFAAVYQAFDRANAMGLHIQTYDSRDVLVEARCDDEAVRRYCQMIRMEYRLIEDVRKDLQEAPVKCLAIDFRDKTGLVQFRDWVHENMAQEVDCFFSSQHYLEVVPKGMNKGDAVKRLCDMLGVDIADAVAVGDMDNDLTMIRTAGIGVAMANGTDQVKAAAKYVTRRDNNHDGVAEVVELFLAEPAE